MIYEPVTEFGKKIADLLVWDDQVRLDIHDYLEAVEPRLKEAFEKAEKWDEEQRLTSREEYEKLLLQQTNLVNKHYNERLEAEDKLEAIKTWTIVLQEGGSAMMTCDNISQILLKLLGSSGFTTKDELNNETHL